MPAFTLSLPIHHRHLFLPVKNRSEKVTFQLLRAGQPVREFNIELARSDPPDWWAFYDLSAFHGETLTLLAVDAEFPPAERAWLESAFTLGDGLPAAGHLYLERYRPQFHYTPMRGWNNDPNGLVYADGEWHLFYQYNPFGTRWGNMHWGHAVSRDLAHWQELPIALFQRSLQDMAYSGSGVVDSANTCGYGSAAQPPLVVAFTSTGRGECLAYSLDRGRTLVEFDHNPVITHQGRDPKIIWYPPENKWVMMVYEELRQPPAAGDRVYAIYDSPDLKTWTRRSALPGLYECPEFFTLPLDGDPAQTRWVVYGCRKDTALSMCMVGDFDGAAFTPGYENAQSHSGPHFYAAQVFNQAPAGRRIMLGWLAGANYPGMPFSQGMTVPLELSLRSAPEGPRLCFYPAAEIETLRTATAAAQGLDTPAANRFLAGNDGELLDIELVVRPRGAFTLDMRGHPITVDPAAARISFAGSTGRLLSNPERVELRLLVDRSVTEVFANGGEAAFAAMTIFEEPLPVAISGDVQIESLRIHHLKSIWP